LASFGIERQRGAGLRPEGGTGDAVLGAGFFTTWL